MLLEDLVVCPVGMPCDLYVHLAVPEVLTQSERVDVLGELLSILLELDKCRNQMPTIDFS
jgi:hypothetical protein